MWVALEHPRIKGGVKKDRRRRSRSGAGFVWCTEPGWRGLRDSCAGDRLSVESRKGSSVALLVCDRATPVLRDLALS